MLDELLGGGGGWATWSISTRMFVLKVWKRTPSKDMSS